MKQAVPMAAWLIPIAISPISAAESDGSEDSMAMEPTRLSLRLTPALARSLGRYYVADEVESLIDLSDDQKSRLSEAIARRLMRLAHANGKALRDSIERGLALLLETDGRFSPETGRAFAELAQPMLPIAREVLNGVADDARPILTPDQLGQLQAKLRRESRELDRFENKMKRWAAGGVKEKEDVDDFEPEDGPEPEREQNDPSRDRMRSAQRWAQWHLKRVGPSEWERYVTAIKHLFAFDDEQSAEADRLLGEYRRRAEVVMTAGWKARFLQNRTRRRLHHYLDRDDVPTAPWRYRLDLEYEKLVEPVEELGRKLREEVFSLTTDEQRRAAMARLRTI